jgi:hypothetical protein
MRHNQNGRRFRGRNDGQRHHQGNHHHHSGGGHNHGSSNNQGGRRHVNPRVQTFDSNGPDVRIRGNAYQINEKYVTLARDAASAGDRILAESYLQHAEHYQRMINDMTEEYNKFNPPQYNNQQQPITGEEPQPVVDIPAQVVQPQQAQQSQQPSQESLEDLDQSFLRPRAKEVETA